ncbi:catalytic activity protein [Colletotrichum paranaense]|uniref:Catalytic activity protein n=1 Tax=Colletotrichum paranaense TaxID=1914294 RepID=A0ABQ9T4P7_9PEZI|nr:catalytic activity protein [Colletotrichum paranaense]KAK1546731.1 catalytic activity protein [Colletotrichum paranaense]
MASSSWRLLKGKTACITGGTTGIGRAITLEYLRHGANVAVNHLGIPSDEKHRLSLIEEAEKIRKDAPKDSPTGELIELAGDVTDPNTGKGLVAAAVKKWGGLDVFIANAGIFKPAEFLTLEKEVFDKTLHVNVNGAFYSCQAAANQMVKQGRGGSIIGISSISALQGGGLQTHYTPTKAAVLSMIQSMAVALAKHRIRCNALLPGTIHTQLAEEDMQNETKRKYLEQRIPMGVGKPHDLAGPAVFLGCEELSGFMTGSQMLVDGGIFNGISIIKMSADDEDSQPYFTRGRLSRGRGLRNSTGWRPPNRKRSGPVVSVTPNSDAPKPTTPREPQSPRSSSPPNSEYQPVVCDDEPAPLPAVTLGEPHTSSIASATTIAPSNDEGIDRSNHASTGDRPAFEQDSPEQVDALCTGITPRGTARTSSSFGANLENATAIWVDLLLQDAAMQEIDFTNVNFEEGVDLFASSVVQSPAVGRGIPNTSGEGLSPTPCASHPYLHERPPTLDEYQCLEKQAWRSATPLPIQAQEHVVFQNFVQHIRLLNAVLALSARHLSLSTHSEDTQTRDPNDALRYYYKTLHYIQEAMQYDTYKTSLELLATSITVSAYEMLDGSRQDWERHLKGVFWIQRSQVIHGDSMGLKQAVWWAWICQDVWAAFRERRRPFTFWRPLKTLDDLGPSELAARSVYFFAQVIAFCSYEETEAGKNDPHARIAAADALREMLENWRRHLTAEFQPLPYPSSPDDIFEPIWINPPAFAVAFQIYYCSHILLLMNVPVLGGLEQYTQQRKRLMECVKKVCGIGMTLSDYPSSVLCSQCLFIAGIPLENSRERKCVLNLLEACHARSGWPVKPLGEELKLRWEASDA